MANLIKFSSVYMPLWFRLALSCILLVGIYPAESANKKNTAKFPKVTLEKAEKDFEVELRALISRINSIRTKSQYIDYMANGLEAKSRKRIRHRLRKMNILPRAYYKGKDSFELVSGKSRFLVKMKSFKDSSFLINGKVWRYDPKKSSAVQLDILNSKLSKFKKSSSASTFSLLVSEAHAVVQFWPIGIAIVNIGSRARTAYHGYRVWRASRAAAKASELAALAAASGSRIAGGPGGSRGRGTPSSARQQREARAAKEQAEAKKAKYDAHEEDYRQRRLREIKVDKELDSGLAKFRRRAGIFAGGAGIALMTQLSFSSVNTAKKNETDVLRELICTYRSLVFWECQKLQVKIEQVAKPATPAAGAKVSFACPSVLLPEYVLVKDFTVKDPDGNQFKGKKIQIIKWLADGETVVQEHFAIPSNMGAELDAKPPSTDAAATSKGKPVDSSPSVANSAFNFLLNSSEPQQSASETAEPILVVDTNQSKQYEFSKNGTLQIIRKLAFKKPRLIMESKATEPPYVPSILPIYDLPEDQQKDYFEKRSEWFENERNFAADANPAISDPKQAEKNADEREKWQKSILAMDVLKDTYNKQCAQLPKESFEDSVEILEPGSSDATQ